MIFLKKLEMEIKFMVPLICKRINTDNYNFSPNIKFDLGYTRLDEWRRKWIWNNNRCFII